MNFQRWEMLLFLGLLIPYTAVIISAYRKAKKGFESITGPRGRGIRFSGRWAGCGITAGIALAGLIFALAGPRWGESTVERSYQGRQVIFCIDISNSMTVSDVGPSRLGTAKEFIRRVLVEAPEMQAGAAIFKGTGVLTVPVTDDHDAVADFVDSVSPALQTAPGTNIESGLAEAVRGFPPNSPEKRYIFLFTDGESTAGDPLKLEETIRKRNIGIWIFCTGTEEGVPLKLETGEIRNTKARPAELEKIAETFDGEFFSLAGEDIWPDYTSRMAGQGSEGEFSRTETIPKERYALFIILAFAAMTAYGVIRIWP